MNQKSPVDPGFLISWGWQVLNRVLYLPELRELSLRELLV